MMVSVSVASIPLVPADVLRDSRLTSCSSSHQILVPGARLIVTPRYYGESVTLHVQMLARGASHADLSALPGSLRAFILIDSSGVLLDLSRIGQTTISLGNIPHGHHTLRYGVYSGITLINGDISCFSN